MNRKLANTLTICALLAVLALAGCYQPVEYPQLAEPHASTTVIPSARYHTVGTSIEGRPIMCLVLGDGSDAALIMATIHGNEPAGTPLVRRLAMHLQQHPEMLHGRKAVLLRVANPDGLAHNSRYNARGVDLNRNFEAANRLSSRQSGLTALSEPESQAIRQAILQYRPDRIVTIHQPLACIDYDGPAQGLAEHMGQYCDLPVKKLGARPGSLGSYAGVTLGIPIVTFEMTQTDSQLDDEALWRKYGKALLAAVVHPDRVE